jgi:hypothetical protein
MTDIRISAAGRLLTAVTPLSPAVSGVRAPAWREMGWKSVGF